MLLAVDFHENFIDEEGIAIAPVLSLQSAGINSTKLDAPEANPFTANSDPSFSEQIFYIAMAKVEAIVEPDSIRNDIWRKSVSFIGIHPAILAISAG